MSFPTSYTTAPKFGKTARQWPLAGPWLVAAVTLLVSVIFGMLFLNMERFTPFYLIAAVGVFAVILVKPEWTTLVILFVLYANMAVVAERNGIPASVAMGSFVLLGLPLLQYVFVRKQRLIISPIMALMVIYLGMLLLSAAFSERASQSTSRITDYIIEGMVLYFLIVNALRGPTLLRKSIWVLIFAGVAMGSISLYQELTGDYENDFGGWAVVKESEINVSDENFLGEREARPRLSGPIGSKNRYAQIMVVLLPLAIAQIMASRSLLLRVFAAAACVPIMAGALLTFSRGAGIALVIILAAFALLKIIKITHLIAASIAFFIVITLVVPDYMYRFATVSNVGELVAGNVDEADGAVLGRATVNLATIYIFMESPILGVGPGQTPTHTRRVGNTLGLRLLSTDRRAHNMYLEELADTGIVGFTGFMSIVMFTMWRLWKIGHAWKKEDPTVYYTLLGLLVAIIAYLATAVFLHLSYIRYYWMILAVAGAAIEVYRTLPTQVHEERIVS